MPDFERLKRSLDLFVTREDEIETARKKGFYAGVDHARLQMLIIVICFAIGVSIYQIFWSK